VLFTTRRYSVTTSRHINFTLEALPGDLPVFRVPLTGDDSFTLRDYPARSRKEWIEHFFTDYRERMAAELRKASKARGRRGEYVAAARALATEANAFAAFFGIRKRLSVPEDVTAALEQITAADKRAAAAALRKQRAHEAACAAYLPRYVAAWRRGSRKAPEGKPEGFRYTGPVLLRVDGEEMVTSMGARVPLEHAVRLWPVILRAAKNGEAYKRNGHTIHVGHFAVDEITTDGTLRAGCHTIPYGELERMARRLKLAVPT
jgi:hypothetical protein